MNLQSFNETLSFFKECGMNLGKELSMKKSSKNENRLKLVMFKNGEIIPDLFDKLPGKSFWVDFNKAKINDVIEKKNQLLNDKEKIISYEKICSIVLNQIKKNIFSKVSMAKKSGYAVSGYKNVKASIVSSNVSILFHAYDGSKKELGRLMSGPIPFRIIKLFNSTELGKIFNKDQVVHCSIQNCGIAKSLLLDLKKLEGLEN